MYMIFAFIGVFLSFMGVLIWKLNLVELIGGYDPKKTADPQGLAKWVGSNIMGMGMLIIIASIIGTVVNGPLYYGIIVFIIIVSVISTITAVGCKKYESGRTQ